MFNLSQAKVSTRLSVLVGLALLGIAALAAMFLVTERRQLMDERKAAVRQTVEVAVSMVGQLEQQVRSGALTPTEARQRALQTLGAMRYAGQEYFWVNDLQGQMVMHPIKPALNGTNMLRTPDPTGKFFFAEMVDVVKARGEGYVEYLWPKPGSEAPQPKVSYVKGVPAWGWLIGSGVYVDSVDAVFADRALAFGLGSLLLIAALLAAGWWIARSILNQLGAEPAYATSITQRIADGDLATPIAVDGAQPGSLMLALKHMRDQLADISGQINRASHAVELSSADIAQGNRDLSARTESQASGLEEAAASMEQLEATVKQNTESAHTARSLAQDTSAIAVRGGEVVSEVVQTMQGISDSSRQIAEIIAVIDSIAFQTNILALNAAVEAARAGEQGRGFAVVAGEVRTLAQRTAEAAKQIKQLITDSVNRVEQGSALVGRAGATMKDVVDSIQRLSVVVTEIASASVEQSEGLSQIGEAVTQMDQSTQQNAALVEQMNGAATHLNQQANDLVQLVARFRLGADQPAWPASPSRGRPAAPRGAASRTGAYST